MSLRIEWRAGVSASCFHAVRMLAAGKTPAVDDVRRALAEPTAALLDELQRSGLPVDAVLRQLAARSAFIEGNRELARTVLVKVAGHEAADSRAPLLAGLLSDAEQAYSRAFPDLLDELELRSRPLREQWEAYGPGLMHAVGKRVAPGLLVDEATVALVQPSAGGGGEAFPETNLVVFEAVLANPLPQLPEVVRLAWLSATLGADLPDFVELLDARRAQTVVAAAVLPAVLEAAGYLELVRPTDALVPTAAEAWAFSLPHPAAAAKLQPWLAFSRDSQAPWGIALKGLERLLFEEG